METCQEVSQMLLDGGIVSQKELDYALRIRKKLNPPRTVSSILVELGTITDDQLRDTIRSNRTTMQIGTLLLVLDLISEQDLQTAIALQKDKPGLKLGKILVDNHFISEDQLLSVLSVQLDIPFLNLDNLPVDKKLTTKVKASWLQQHMCFPIRGTDGSLQMAFADPLQEFPLDEAESFFGQKPESVKIFFS